MKNTIMVLAFLSCLNIVMAQNKEKPVKIDFKNEIKPLLEQQKEKEAIPLIKKYFQENLILGNVWSPKVIILESENMFRSELILAKFYDNLAFKENSTNYADTSIIWYNRMLLDKHRDSIFAKDRINALKLGKSEFLLNIEKNKQNLKIEEERIAQEKLNRENFTKDSINTQKKEENRKLEEEKNEFEVYQKAINSKDSISLSNFLINYPQSKYFNNVKSLYDSTYIVKSFNIESKESILTLLNNKTINQVDRDKAIQSLIKFYIPKEGIQTINNLEIINKIFDSLNYLNKKYDLKLAIENELSFSTFELNENEPEWTSKNLNVSHFQNGDLIPYAKSNEEWRKASELKQPAWCYYNNDSVSGDFSNKLYNFYAISDPRGIISYNFKIPSIDDFNKLVEYAGGENNAGTELKCIMAWEEGFESEKFIPFNAFPSGFRDNNGNFIGETTEVGFWSTTEDSNEKSKILYLKKGNKSVNLDQSINKGYGFSVRLLENSNLVDLGNTNVEIFNQLKIKRDEIILKEFSKIKSYDEELNFLTKQLSREFGWKNTLLSEIDDIQLDILHNRFFNNPKIIKNGFYPASTSYSSSSSCGEGFGGDIVDPASFINFSNNKAISLKWENGASYTGEIESNYPQGKGKYISGKDIETGLGGGDIFEGIFDLGYISNGKITYKDKKIYIGEISDFLPNGKGIMTLANGQKENGNFENGIFIKPYVCKTATIESQVWMAENLKVTKFRNGDDIPEARTMAEWAQANRTNSPAFCYYNNDPSTASKYGVIYNYYAVSDPRGIAPNGWKIPSEKDIKILSYNINKEFIKEANAINEKNKQGINTVNLRRELEKKYDDPKTTYINMKPVYKHSPYNCLTKIKSTQDWQYGNGTNVFGFNCKPTPLRFDTGEFKRNGFDVGGDNGGACYWLSDESNITSEGKIVTQGAKFFEIEESQIYTSNINTKTTYHLGNGLVIRCIKE